MQPDRDIETLILRIASNETLIKKQPHQSPSWWEITMANCRLYKELTFKLLDEIEYK